MLLKLVHKVIAKTKKALSEGGIRLLVVRFLRFVYARTIHLFRSLFYKPPVHRVFKDVLIVNGCTLLHPSRYRVDHQIEQMEYFNMSADQIYTKHLTLRHLHLYRAFIFFRCPSNQFIEDFVDKAKTKNKKCFFDIDDLIYDLEYTSSIEYVETMDEKHRKKYMSDVVQTGRMLELCDYGITTTGELQRSMLERKGEVFLNRNVASSKMLDISYNALLNKLDKSTNREVRIGYLSGSVTHNPDLLLIEDALFEVASRFSNVTIVLVGMVSPTPKLARLKGQIELVEFMKWTKLPELLVSLDINIAPLENTRFNRAKSENKWQEAALVKVPTVASNVGAFKEVIKHSEDGFLCSTTTDWVETLSLLVANPDLSTKIGGMAHERVINNYITQKSGLPLVEFLKSRLTPLYVFVLPTLMLSGGMRVILQHAKLVKQSGADVLLYVDSDDEIQDFEFEGESFSVIATRKIDLDATIDNMVATLWTTVDRVLAQKNTANKTYLVQNYETDFYEASQLLQKQRASSTYMHTNAIEYLTISKWCQSWLKQIYKVNATYIPNGIDCSNFIATPGRVVSLNDDIHVLVEGNCDDAYKNIDESMMIVQQLKKEYGDRIICHFLAYRAMPKDTYPVDRLHFKVPFDKVVDIYQQCHVLIKSSKVESFSYPPLEMMATGGLAIVGANDGNAEYTKHGQNCMLYEIGNLDQAMGHFRRLVNDFELRSNLAHEGIKTALDRDWKTLSPEIINYWQN